MNRQARTILHVDMDAFFAAVELRRRPELAGHALVVGGRGDPSRRGVVSTASYEARQYGVHSGMPLRTAARLCPHALFLPVDFAAYTEASGAVYAILEEVTPLVETVGLDEAYLDVSHRGETPLALGAALKRRIHAVTGLVASVGIAPNRLLAKIASDLEKPDGLTVLTGDDVPTRVWPLPVRTLHGVGPRTAERLHALGVRTIGELAAIPAGGLQGAVGARHAAALRRAAHGIDDRPVGAPRQRKSIGRERTFQQDCRSSHRLRVEAEAMLRDSLERMRARSLRSRTVTVKIRYRDFVTRTRSLSLPRASDDEPTLVAAVVECLHAHTLHRAVRLIGVQLSGLAATESGHSPDSNAPGS